MINKNDHYAAYALLLYELDAAKEHLEHMMQRMQDDPEFDEIDYHIDLAHIYEHLNRAWNGRHEPHPLTDEQWKAFSAFPTDITPLDFKP